MTSTLTTLLNNNFINLKFKANKDIFSFIDNIKLFNLYIKKSILFTLKLLLESFFNSTISLKIVIKLLLLSPLSLSLLIFYISLFKLFFSDNKFK